MNLNKYTKAELISKFKKIDVKNNSNNNQSQIKLVELLNLLKGWIMKLTIIALIFKYFKKYTFISKILRFANWIIVSIFGFSVVDNFGIGYISSFVTDIRLIVAGITAYLTSTQFYAYLGSLWGLKVTNNPEISKRTWSSSTVYPKSSWNENQISESERNSRIAEWLRSNEHKADESSNNKYYILLLLLILSGATWYYYGGDITPPRIGWLWGWIEGCRNTINEIRSINRTARDTAATAQETMVSAKEFLRKKDNNTFELESADLLKSMMEWHKLQVNPLNDLDIKTQYNSYKIIETRIEQLENKFPDDFKIWMADRYSSVYSMVNNFWNVGPTIANKYYDKYPNIIEQETLNQQKEWSDHSSNRSIIMSPEMGELSMDQIPQAPLPPIAPTAPPTAPPAPPVNPLLESIKKGKSLKPTETIVKDNIQTGKVIGENIPTASSSNVTLDPQKVSKPTSFIDALSAKFDKIKKAASGSDDENDPTQNVWDDEHTKSSLPRPSRLSTLIEEAPKLDDSQLLKAVKEIPEITIDSENNSPENKTPAEVQTSLSGMWDSIRSSVSSTPRIGSVGLKPELTPLTEIIDKGKNLLTFEDLKQEYKHELEQSSSNLKPDTIIDRFLELEDYKEDGYLDSIIERNIDDSVNQMIDDNPGINKQQLIEKLIKQNPKHKDRILNKIAKSVEIQLSSLESKLSEKDIKKLRRQLTKEDLNEIASLGDNKTIDQIKALKAVNKSHSNLLEGIKNKASQSSIVKTSDDSNTQHLDDTMNLFD